jgi:hypothetical protein
MSRSATTRLDAGQHSIDRVQPTKKDGRWMLFWSIRLYDGRLLRKQSQGLTKGEARARAKTKANELLTSSGGIWRTTSQLSKYVEQVSKPAIASAQLRESSRQRYLIVLKQLLGDCKPHKHRDSLKGHSVASGTTFRVLEDCLREVAQLHGHESAHQARSVLSKYIMAQLKRDGLITADPIKGERLEFGPKPAQQRGGKALSRAEYERVVDYLLNLDPAKNVQAPRRGRWTLADRIAKRRNAIDLTLLQAATGLRISEASSISWSEHVELTDDGKLRIEVSPGMSKLTGDATFQFSIQASLNECLRD